MQAEKSPSNIWDSKMNKPNRPHVHRIGKIVAQRCTSCGASGQEYYLRIDALKEHTVMHLCIDCEGHLTAAMINAYLHVKSGRWTHDAYRGLLPKGEEFERKVDESGKGI